jgi:hypothetical protein
MRLTPALAYEKLRQDADSMNKIILNKDGKWYHVYEWSAWLLKTVVCTEEMQQARGDAKPLAVSHCNTKTGDYVMAGFSTCTPHSNAPSGTRATSHTCNTLSAS